MEIWKDIKGYKGYYQISNKGRVKSLGRKTGEGTGNYYRKEKILKSTIVKIGYKTVRLTKYNKSKAFYIHRLIGKYFILNPENKPEINHINGIKGDNRLENLEWCSHLENMQHAFKTGLVKDTNRKKPVLMLNINNNPLLIFESQVEAERQTNISHVTISACCLKRKHNKTAGGYKWEYYQEGVI